MKNLLMLFTLIVLGVSFTACEKEIDVEENEKTVTATINSPTEGAMMNNGNSLNVNVTFTDPTELHNYSVVVLDENTNATVLNVSGHTHNKNYTLDSTITLSVAAHSTFKVKAIATNHSGEEATDVVSIEVHP